MMGRGGGTHKPNAVLQEAPSPAMVRAICSRHPLQHVLAVWPGAATAASLKCKSAGPVSDRTLGKQ